MTRKRINSIWNEIKLFYEKHRILSIIAIIAAVICLSYSATYKLPDYLGIEGWYQLFNNLSISYIAALIFLLAFVVGYSNAFVLRLD